MAKLAPLLVSLALGSWLPAPHALASIAKPGAGTPSALALRKEIAGSSKRSFAPLLRKWSTRYGSKAVGPLLQIARDEKTADPQRYVALMGAARLGGNASAPLLTPFLKSPSWMMRTASLRALSALKHPATSLEVLPLLRDPALVVRAEAVEAVRALKPAGAEEALAATALDPRNYHAGRAQWVPQLALAALRDLGARPGARSAAPKLAPLLDRGLSDPELQKSSFATLERLTGKKAPVGEPGRTVAFWKTYLKTLQ